MFSSTTFFRNRYFLPDKMVLLPFLILCFVLQAKAQQLDQLGKKQGVKVSGGLGLNQSLYFADGVSDRFNPYNYVVSGNVAMNLYGIDIPVSFTFSNRNFKYSQPFNIVGISPSYKSLRLHAGYRTMSFSQYTLAGHNFLGGGLEWGHKGFKVAAMGGRLLRAVEFDSANIEARPAYERLGTGIMLGYGKDGDEITFITFYAKDQANSIRTVPTLVGLRPMENQVYSLGFKKKLSDKLSVYFEGARSGLTRDVRDSSESNSSGFYKTVYFLSQNKNTEFKNAFKTGFSFNLTAFQLGLNFERVDPGYNTLGAYYVNSDFQNLTGSFSTRVFKDKVNISANAGLQRDDLENQKMSKMKRFVGSLNLNLNFTKRLNASASYSNFNSFTNVKPVDQAFVQNTIYDRIDTLNFVQINQTVNASLNYVPLDNSRIMHQLSIGGNYNTAVSKTSGNKTQNALSGGRVSYMLNWKESGLNIGLNANNNTNYYVQGQASFWGLGLMLSKPVLNKKLRISLNGNASNNYENGRLTAMLYSVTNSYSVKLGKHHSLNASLRYSGRQSKSTAELSYYKTTFNEFMGNLGYFFTF
jgi:hypothetical protein